MKKIITLFVVTVHCYALWGQTAYHNNVHEQPRVREFMQLPQITRLVESELWNASAFPEAYNDPYGDAAFRAFSTKELVGLSAVMEHEGQSGTPVKSSRAELVSEKHGSFIDQYQKVPAILRIVREEVHFSYDGALNFRLLRTHYLFISIDGVLISGFSETVWQDIETAQYNYYVNPFSGETGEQITLTVFPNPAVDEITIEAQLPALSGFTVSLTDNQGRGLKVLVNGSSSGYSYRNTFSISDLAAGLYHITVKMGDLSATQKFVKR